MLITHLEADILPPPDFLVVFQGVLYAMIGLVLSVTLVFEIFLQVEAFLLFALLLRPLSTCLCQARR